MGRKKILEKRQARLLAKKAELLQRSRESEDINEVRAINEQLTTIAEDLQDIADELLALAEDEGAEGASNEDEGAEGRAKAPAQVVSRQVVNGQIVGAFAQQTNAPEARANVNALDTIEYRNAFAEYVRTGNWNYEQRDTTAGMVITSDVGKIIPNTIMKEFIKELKVYGNLYNRVRKLNVKGGVEFPIEELVPTVTWITETTTSTAQSAPEYKTSVSFGYHICEARIAQSLLSQIVSLDVLESEIAKLLAEAFIKEFDNIILNGTGAGQPLGILNDTRVKAGNKVAFTAAEVADWTKWRKKLFAIIPLAYRGQGVMVMTANTWESYIMTLKDANNNPIASETFNVQDGTTTCRFAGKEVILVEADILKDFDTAGSGEAFAIYFKPNDYAINSQLQIGFKRYFNDDTNKWVNKGLCVMDGKLLDVNGVYLLTK